MIWKPSRFTSITATLSQGLEDGPTDIEQGLTDTGFRVALDQSVGANVALSASGRYDRAAFPSSPEIQSVVGLTAMATYYLTRNVALSLSYDFTSANDSTQGQLSFTRNQVTRASAVSAVMNQTSRSAHSIKGVVLILCPGGLENGGGIGRQMGYFLDAMRSQISTLDYRVIDTRGPWFLGAAPAYKAASLLYLARAAGRHARRPIFCPALPRTRQHYRTRQHVPQGHPADPGPDDRVAIRIACSRSGLCR